MSKKIKDVFGLWQIKEEPVEYKEGIPHLYGSSVIPKRIVPFSKCKKEIDKVDTGVHFYEYDEKFFHVFESEYKTKKVLEVLKEYKCVITPDYSVYTDMPLIMQKYQIYRSHAIGAYLRQNGIKIIPNIRWGEEETYEVAFNYVEPWGIVSVGVEGAGKNKKNTECFEKGFIKMLETIDPETVLTYGTLSPALKYECEVRKIGIKEYKTEIEKRLERASKKEYSIF